MHHCPQFVFADVQLCAISKVRLLHAHATFTRLRGVRPLRTISPFTHLDAFLPPPGEECVPQELDAMPNSGDASDWRLNQGHIFGDAQQAHIGTSLGTPLGMGILCRHPSLAPSIELIIIFFALSNIHFTMQRSNLDSEVGSSMLQLKQLQNCHPCEIMRHPHVATCSIGGMSLGLNCDFS